MGLSVSKDRQIKDDWYLETFAEQRRTGGTEVNRPCIQMPPLYAEYRWGGIKGNGVCAIFWKMPDCL